MKISVLIAVYNAKDTIKSAIESILYQTYQDFEIIIIDDNCTDDTINIINTFNDDRIKIFSNLENLGQIRSLNIGLKHCSGEYIARMDADDISLHRRFELQLKEFNKDPELVFVGTDGYKIFPNGKIKKVSYYPRNIEALTLLSMYKNPFIHISVMIKSN